MGKGMNELDKVMKKIREEGDEKFFKYQGYPCVILRQNQAMLHLCGYVGVPEGHSMYQHYPYEQRFENHFNVHGGINYFNFDLPAIDEVKRPSEEFWYLGFSCTHLGDIIPIDHKRCYQLKYEYEGRPFFHGDTYKDMSYVEKEIRNLADQLKQL